jgi:hypothetical protein
MCLIIRPFIRNFDAVYLESSFNSCRQLLAFVHNQSSAESPQPGDIHETFIIYLSLPGT